MKTTRPLFPSPAVPFTTPRLLLRPMRAEDAADLHILRTQYEVMKWTSTAKMDADLAFTASWMARFLPPNDATTFNFVVEELSNPGRVIGIAGSHIAEPPECGYMLRSDMWGKGYATEAVKAWLIEHWKLPRKEVDVDEQMIGHFDRHVDNGIYRELLRADIVEDNLASAKVLKKCGFVRAGSEQQDENGQKVTVVYLYLERPV
ncbi:hypothetical protein DV736_g5844, partial [Chaetothyriales sp. CBS 134916]